MKIKKQDQRGLTMDILIADNVVIKNEQIIDVKITCYHLPYLITGTLKPIKN